MRVLMWLMVSFLPAAMCMVTSRDQFGWWRIGLIVSMVEGPRLKRESSMWRGERWYQGVNLAALQTGVWSGCAFGRGHSHKALW